MMRHNANGHGFLQQAAAHKDRVNTRHSHRGIEPMARTALIGRRCPLLLFVGILAYVTVTSAQAPPAKSPKVDQDLKALLPRLKPLEPDEALRSFRIDKGLRIELAAAEPAVTDPIAG